MLKKDVVSQNSKDMRLIITGCTVIIGAMWLLFAYIYIDGEGTDSLIPILITIWTMDWISCILQICIRFLE